MPVKTLLGLVACNAIWAANPIMSKILLERFDPHQVAWLRYASATAAFIVAWLLYLSGRALRPNGKALHFFARPATCGDAGLILGLGFSAFCFAPMVGLTGLDKTGAVDNAILIALEPVVTVGLAAIFLSERLDRIQLLSFMISIAGFSILSGLAGRPVSSWSSDPLILGNFILVISLLGEGGYSIFASKLLGRYSMLPVFGTGLLAGFAVLTMATAASTGLPGPEQLGARELLALAWLGPLGSTLTYLYWALALSRTEVTSAALTLFVQPVVGAILGVWVFAEKPGASKLAGAAMIFAAVGLLTLRQGKTAVSK